MTDHQPMPVALIAAAALALALPAHAADKGGPPATLDQIMALSDRKAGSCHVETSVTGTYLRADRDASFGIGGGCDALLSNLIIGAGFRADWTDGAGDAVGSVYAKLGIAINAGATLYGLAEWKVPGWDVGNAGQLAIGGGAELKLEFINPALSVFAEGTFAATKFGAATKDDVNSRLGLRYRF